jgi:hypothetical protein
VGIASRMIIATKHDPVAKKRLADFNPPSYTRPLDAPKKVGGNNFRSPFDVMISGTRRFMISLERPVMNLKTDFPNRFLPAVCDP